MELTVVRRLTEGRIGLGVDTRTRHEDHRRGCHRLNVNTTVAAVAVATGAHHQHVDTTTTHPETQVRHDTIGGMREMTVHLQTRLTIVGMAMMIGLLRQGLTTVVAMIAATIEHHRYEHLLTTTDALLLQHTMRIRGSDATTMTADHLRRVTALDMPRLVMNVDMMTAVHHRCATMHDTLPHHLVMIVGHLQGATETIDRTRTNSVKAGMVMVQVCLTW